MKFRIKSSKDNVLNFDKNCLHENTYICIILSCLAILYVGVSAALISKITAMIILQVLNNTKMKPCILSLCRQTGPENSYQKMDDKILHLISIGFGIIILVYTSITICMILPAVSSHPITMMFLISLTPCFAAWIRTNSFSFVLTLLFLTRQNKSYAFKNCFMPRVLMMSTKSLLTNF